MIRNGFKNIVAQNFCYCEGSAEVVIQKNLLEDEPFAVRKQDFRGGTFLEIQGSTSKSLGETSMVCFALARKDETRRPHLKITREERPPRRMNDREKIVEKNIFKCYYIVIW
jgi:hypothetical protein